MANRILVADDDPHLREIICFALEKAGMQPVAARDGAQALACFAGLAPDLVILDIGMPEMDGLDVPPHPADLGGAGAVPLGAGRGDRSGGWPRDRRR